MELASIKNEHLVAVKISKEFIYGHVIVAIVDTQKVHL